MTSQAENKISAGTFTGVIGDRYRYADLLEQLEGIEDLLEGKDAEVLTAGRNRNIKVTLLCQGRPLDVVVKAFSPPSMFKSLLDAGKGSKARRTWVAAAHLDRKGVGTPSPIGYLESHVAGKLAESYYIAEFQDGASNFKDELISLFRTDPDCGKFMTLMQCVADAVKAMHEAGFQHNDLGNQNILLRRTGEGLWGDVRFIDLNRGRIRDSLSLREKARDLSRIYLPSDLMRVFKEMYFAPVPPPHEFLDAEKYYRRLYAIHSGTRSLRHPVRTRRLKVKEHGRADYPSEKDMWIWDERSGQAISALRSADRTRYYGLERHLQIAWATLVSLLPVWQAYRSLLRTCYQSPVVLHDRIGVAIQPAPETVDRELALLEGLGTIPVFIRFYAHKGSKEWAFLAHIVKTLHGEGHSVSIALVQDRKAVLDPARWARFVTTVLDLVDGHVDAVEIGHAINRVKWGIWDFEEYHRLVEAVAAIADRYPAIRFTGPAVIDFEYPFLLAALDRVPEPLHLSALSHHLYVDRRGAPENRQGPFSSLEKFALARAIARTASPCDDRLVISEVNWPLKGTGVYSPVGSPYESPGPRFNDPSVTEDEYADYMLRYIAMALCSGMVDRLFWWRLVARGYGLVDDTVAGTWRNRPAYVMLKNFLSLLGTSTFVEKLPVTREGVNLFVFSTPGGKKICMAWSSSGEVDTALPFECSGLVTAMGVTSAAASGGLHLSGRPVYVLER